ncbi:outer membrane protein [Loktanella agnita]|uniref:outer membrane protein n=1 Tax=Loktanella agnita TaxID=287097 RepID=UPI00398A32CD
MLVFPSCVALKQASAKICWPENIKTLTKAYRATTVGISKAHVYARIELVALVKDLYRMRALFFGTSAILAVMSAAQSARAQGMGDQWYVSVFAGFSNIGSIDTVYDEDDVANEFDDSYLLGLTVGMTVAPNLRGEIELSYASYESGRITYNGEEFYASSEGDASTTFLMANIWYDLPAASFGSAVPYIGGGIGAVRLEADTRFGGFEFGYNDTVTGAAAQVGAGIQFPMGTGKIDVAYHLKSARGLDIADPNSDEPYADGTFLSHNLQVGYVTTF